MWSACAGNFKPNLIAPLNPLLERIATFLSPSDVLLDVGGGAGRLSLPLAGRCGEVVCIDPSPSMGEAFVGAAREAGISNARFIGEGWMEAGDVEGDVALVAHVTYFVPQIAPFLAKLDSATRSRVIIVARDPAAPNQFAPFFRLVRDEEQALVPGYRELVPALEELGINAELIDAGDAQPPAAVPLAKTRDDAVRNEVEGGIRLGWMKPDEAERAAELFHKHFDDLLVETPDGFRRRNALDARELIITWETRR
jgi:SAM-dependent methyltransferase